MSVSGINYFHNLLGLDENNFKIFYSFESGDFLESNPLADASFSGEIFGNDFFEQNGSGNFSEACVKIKNVSGLNQSQNTFIFTQEQISNGGGVIFSSLEGTQNKSGFSFGINDANRLYFEYYNANLPVVRTFDNIPSDKNLYTLKFSPSNLSFGYYNFNSKLLESQSFSISTNSYFPSENWYLGSGENQKRYTGYIDNFLYFNNSIPDATLTRLLSGIWNKVNEEEVVTGGSFSIITGYQSIVTGEISGNPTSVFYELSGFDTEFYDKEIFSYNLLTGSVSSGEKILKFLGPMPEYCLNRPEIPIYFEEIVSSSTTGITGVEKILSGVDQIGIQKPVYQKIESGSFIQSGQLLIPIFGNFQSGITGFLNTPVPDWNYLKSFGMKSLTYLGDFELESFPNAVVYQNQVVVNNGVPVIYGVGLEDFPNAFEGYAISTGDRIDWFNNESTFNFSSLQFILSQQFPSGSVDVYLDGILNSTGDYSITGGPINFGINHSGDYFISGNRLFFKNSVNQNNRVFYDFGRVEDAFTINSSDYQTGKFIIDRGNHLFFHKGYKLIQGVDYSGDSDSGVFWPSEEVIGFPVVALPKRKDQFNLSNFNIERQIDFELPEFFISGTTGDFPAFEIGSGNLNLPSTFLFESGSYTLNSGVFGSGEYISTSGNMFFDAYTGWQLYSGNDVYDVKFNLDNPPISGWENGTELFFAYDSSPQYTLSGEPFLKDTSIVYRNRVKRINLIEHGTVDLIKNNRNFDGGLSNFFLENEDFWN